MTFTVLFAIARTVGWIAQWKEMIEDPSQRIGRWACGRWYLAWRDGCPSITRFPPYRNPRSPDQSPRWRGFSFSFGCPKKKPRL